MTYIVTIRIDHKAYNSLITVVIYRGETLFRLSPYLSLSKCLPLLEQFQMRQKEYSPLQSWS